MQPLKSVESIDEMNCIGITDYRFEIARLRSFDRYRWIVSAVNLQYPKIFAIFIIPDIMMPCNHKRRSPNCRFVRIMPCENVRIDINPNLIPPRVPKMEEICNLNPLEFDLNTIIEILSTPHLWPVTVTQKKEDLAAASFIYANDGSRVYCFYCGGDVEIWKLKDDPKQDHIKWYPNCKFINRLLEDLAEKQS
ncbi:hypothetical protein ACFW04_002644 [Cataglyphis niger]